MKTIVLVLALFWNASIFARGGMIGGGDVSFRAILECDASGIDPTFNEATYVWLAEEVNEDGERVENSNLRIVTMDKSRQPIHYYVTHESRLYSHQQINIPIWRYDVGSAGNTQIGFFQWNRAQGTGVFSVEELRITNCN